jgi:molecular chaperone DnaK (HSP70)
MNDGCLYTVLGLLVAGNKSVLVFDIGGIRFLRFSTTHYLCLSGINFAGGTTDLTVARIKDGHHEVDLTCGHANLGGMRMDALLCEYVISRISEGLCQDY